MGNASWPWAPKAKPSLLQSSSNPSRPRTTTPTWTSSSARLVFSSFIDSELDLSRDHCVSVRAQIYALKKESSHSMDPIKRDRMTTVLQLEELKKEIDNLIAVYKSDLALLTAERVHREGLIRRAAEAAASKDWAVYLPLYCDRKERGILLHEWNTATGGPEEGGRQSDCILQSDLALLTTARVDREDLVKRACDAAASKDWAVIFFRCPRHTDHGTGHAGLRPGDRRSALPPNPTVEWWILEHVNGIDCISWHAYTGTGASLAADTDLMMLRSLNKYGCINWNLCSRFHNYKLPGLLAVVLDHFSRPTTEPSSESTDAAESSWVPPSSRLDKPVGTKLAWDRLTYRPGGSPRLKGRDNYKAWLGHFLLHTSLFECQVLRLKRRHDEIAERVQTHKASWDELSEKVKTLQKEKAVLKDNIKDPLLRQHRGPPAVLVATSDKAIPGSRGPARTPNSISIGRQISKLQRLFGELQKLADSWEENLAIFEPYAEALDTSMTMIATRYAEGEACRSSGDGQTGPWHE
ncbi:hypothetical protein IWZ00DRAFT_527470 [Phyllosticta capitalensis]